MGNISESVLSGDTSNIILDWNDTVTMFRATTTIIAGQPVLEKKHGQVI